jgi:hypothetical protein
MSKTPTARNPGHATKPGRGLGVPKPSNNGQFTKRDAAHKSYGQGLPPAGPANELVTTPSVFPYPRDDDSAKGKEGR